MSNSLIFKVQPTLSIDSVETDLNNYQITEEYTTRYGVTSTVAGSGTLVLPGPTSLPSTIPFIELVTDNDDIDLTFKDAGAATITSLTDINYLAGNFKGYDFSITNNGVDDAEITWRIYY